MRFPIASFLFLLLCGCNANPSRVVLYCAQDREFAVDLLDDFSQENEWNVTPRFDSEANKSVGLYVELVQDRQRPRCDVFWNNEIISTIRLQKQGLLQPYKSPSSKSFPSWTKASDHTWQAFAARARIIIVNTNSLNDKPWPKSIFDLTDPQWKGQVVMAKPHHGTSATHAACLFASLGSEKAETFYRKLHQNEVQLAPGNKQVAEWVAAGKTPSGQRVAIGLTDTDDAMVEIEAGKNVAIIFPDSQGIDAMGTLFIPNTVSMIKGCPNPEGAKKLIDYLLSADNERRLAEGSSHQFPLNPEVKAQLPEVLATSQTVKKMECDFEKAAEVWEQAQQTLRSIFAR